MKIATLFLFQLVSVISSQAQENEALTETCMFNLGSKIVATLKINFDQEKKPLYASLQTVKKETLWKKSTRFLNYALTSGNNDCVPFKKNIVTTFGVWNMNEINNEVLPIPTGIYVLNRDGNKTIYNSKDRTVLLREGGVLYHCR